MCGKGGGVAAGRPVVVVVVMVWWCVGGAKPLGRRNQPLLGRPVPCLQHLRCLVCLTAAPLPCTDRAHLIAPPAFFLLSSFLSAAGGEDGRARGHQRPDLRRDHSQPRLPAAAGHSHRERQEDAAEVRGWRAWCVWLVCVCVGMNR